MTPEQLKALMVWAIAAARGDIRVAELLRKNVFTVFGFDEDPDGNPVAREIETCELCGRHYAPGEEHTHGCGGPSSDTRPANCRERLQEEGKPYPKSRCVACGQALRIVCPHKARRP